VRGTKLFAGHLPFVEGALPFAADFWVSNDRALKGARRLALSENE